MRPPDCCDCWTQEKPKDRTMWRCPECQTLWIKMIGRWMPGGLTRR